MNIRILKYPNTDWILSRMRQTRCTPRGAQIMSRKYDSWVVQIDNVPFQAANIIKQEMLSASGEAAVSAGAVEGRVISTPVILIATTKNMNYFIKKMYNQPYGLPALADTLKKFIKNIETPKKLTIKEVDYDLSGQKSYIMGIVNASSDSFYAGSRLNTSDVSYYIRNMIQDGADILDIGGQATNPKAHLISEEEELLKIVPLLNICRREFDIPVSIDTFRPSVAAEAANCGADIINDVSNLSDNGMLNVLLNNPSLYYILTHNRGEMENMNKDNLADYRDTTGDVYDELSMSIDKYTDHGLSPDKLILDIGLGFAKNTPHNMELLNNLKVFDSMGLPVLVGHSRKRFTGAISGVDEPEDRLSGSLAVMGYAYTQGARLFRTHDVLESRRYLNALEALHENELKISNDYEEFEN